MNKKPMGGLKQKSSMIRFFFLILVMRIGLEERKSDD